MLEEVSNGRLSFRFDGFFVEMDLQVRCAVSLGLFDLKDAALLSKNAENGVRSTDVSLHPLLVLDIVVLEASHSAQDEVEPTQVNNLPALFLGELGQKSSLHVLEERQVKGHAVGFAFLVEGSDLAEDAAPGFVGLVEGGDLLAVEGRKEVWFFVEEAARAVAEQFMQGDDHEKSRV